ncbi:MAG: deoxyribose-phosphate aldolase [Clostridia bacterium]|nr:deoxyribose-phosphate aldolase [Clostridia bacterium]
MEKKELLAITDHTLLAPASRPADILRTVDEGILFKTASVCIPPCYVKLASAHAKGAIPICTVIGFPHGNSSPAAKANEARLAAEDGADEIDMVINIGLLKAGDTAAALSDIRGVRAACRGKILKVIVETAMLTEEEKRTACEIVSQSGADFIKTSTGYGGGGATPADVRLLRCYTAPSIRVKAAGGIASFDDAEAMVAAGADRLGTSRLVKLYREEVEK